MRSIVAAIARLEQKLAIVASSRAPAKPMEARPDRPIISFTFDDVPNTAFTIGAPILEAHGARGTFYISGSLCGTVEEQRCLITAEQSLGLHRAGHEIGCHMFTHRRLHWREGEALEQDIARNAAFFASLSPGIGLRNFSYPYNTPTPSAKRQLAAHFESCRAGLPGLNKGPIDLAMLNSVEISRNGADLAGVRTWIDRVKSEGGWLIFVTHDVAENPTRWGTTPQIFNGAVACAQQSGCEVLTIDAALGRLQGRNAT